MLACRMGGGLGMTPRKRGAAGTPPAPTPGPELWPQPTFDAPTGVTSTRGSITGGQFVANNSGLGFAQCQASAPGGTFAVGTVVQYSFDVIATNGNDAVRLIVAGASIRSNVATTNGTQTISGTATLTVATNQDMILRVDNNDVGVVKFDNCHINILS